MDKARKAAVAAVIRLHKGGWANLTAKTVLAGGALSSQEKAFATAVFYGTAERQGTLDALLAQYVSKPLARLDVEVRAILETGLYQILYMNVPPSAAVNEAVKLARGFGKSSAAGFVNAVLRKAQHAKVSDFVFADEVERLMFEGSVSRAVASAVMEACPQDYDAFLQASFAKPELCLRVNTLKTTPQELAERLAAAGAKTRPGQVENSLYAGLAGGVVQEENFLAGRYHVQGEASQFACACVAAQPGQKVLDVCAAPGGKSATLAQQMGGEAGLTACDVRENRLPLIQEALGRLGIEGVRVLLNDAAEYRAELEGQDRVLCDVPCSGLGVLASKPDIRYTDGGNFDSLPPLQLEILTTASRYVHKGGRLVYSTCTIRPQENQQVVQAFLRQNPQFAPVLPQGVPQGALVQDKMVTILPQNTGLDGFFVATMERL